MTLNSRKSRTFTIENVADKYEFKFNISATPTDAEVTADEPPPPAKDDKKKYLHILHLTTICVWLNCTLLSTEFGSEIILVTYFLLFSVLVLLIERQQELLAS